MSTDIMYYIAGLLSLPAFIIGWEYFGIYKKNKKDEEKKSKKNNL